MAEKSNDSRELPSPQVLEDLKDVLGEKYDYAISVVTYAEVKSLEFNYTGMAEFRDALTHVKRALYTNDERNALEELNSASEHIRRAAVESMQEYVETRYVNLRRRMYLPSMYWFRRNDKRIKELESELKKNIIDGRSAKPSKKWRESIGYFTNAERILDQLEREIPTIDERIYLAKSFVYIMAGLVIGYLIAII